MSTPTTTAPMPFDNDRIYVIDTGIVIDEFDNTLKFNFNVSNTANAGDERPNTVYNFGWNMTPGGGADVSGETYLGMGLESHYVPEEGNEYNEWHIYWGDKTGTQHRPLSFRIDKNTGNTNCLLHAGGLFLFGDNTVYNYGQLSQGGYSHLFANNGGGIPSYGMQWSGDVSNVTLAKVGSNNLGLIFQGWQFWRMAPGLEFAPSDGTIYFKNTSAVTKGYVGNTGGTGGNLEVALQDGADLVVKTVGGGGGEGLRVDYATGYVFPKLGTFADNAAAVTAGVPVGALYKNPNGGVRVVI